MDLLPFSRSDYLADRLNRRVADPFHVEVADYELSQALDPAAVRDYASALVATYDSFRLRFAWHADGEPKAYVHPRTTIPVHVAEVDDIGRIAAGKRAFREAAIGRIDLFEGNAAEVFYYWSPREDRAIVRLLCSHFSTDFITHQLIRAASLNCLLQGRPLPQAPKYENWLRAYGHYASGLAGEAEGRFWLSLPMKAFSAVQQMAAGRSGTEIRIVRAELPGSLLAACVRFGAQVGGRLSDVVAAGLVRAMGQMYECDPVPLSWTGHGRYPLAGSRFSDTAGWHSDNHPLSIGTKGKTGPALVREIRSILLTTPACGGAFRWVSRFGPQIRGGLMARLATPFRINFRQHGKLSADEAALAGGQSEAKIVWTQTLASTQAQPLDISFSVDLGPASSFTLTITGRQTPGEAEALVKRAYACLAQLAGYTPPTAVDAVREEAPSHLVLQSSTPIPR